MFAEIILKARVSSVSPYSFFVICSAVAEASGTAFVFFRDLFLYLIQLEIQALGLVGALI